MQVFIMRHGEAELQAGSDSLRALTPQGRSQSHSMAVWLRQKGVRIDQVLVSPYVRAMQTLEVLRETLVLPERADVQQALTPGGDAGQVCHHLRQLAENGADAVLIVSHLPLVGYLVAALCPQETPPMFATSAVSCVSLDKHSGRGVLHWQMKPVDLPRAG